MPSSERQETSMLASNFKERVRSSIRGTAAAAIGAVVVSGTWVAAQQMAPRPSAVASVPAATMPNAGGIPKTLANYQNIPLWEAGKVPMATGSGPLDAPFLTVFQAPAAKRTGAVVIIAPGGGNIMLMYGAEGFETGERYNEWGTTAFVLTHRLSPKYNNQARVLDGQRAVRLVRANAQAWGLDPNRIGFVGFSAGSALGRSVAGVSPAGNPEAADPIDRVSARPDYLGLVYSAGNASPGESLKDFPPTFLLAAQADQGPSLGNAQLFMELTRAGAVAEMHTYQRGRHGFGDGSGSPEFGLWMDQLKHFLELNGMVQAPGKGAGEVYSETTFQGPRPARGGQPPRPAPQGAVSGQPQGAR
jgi:acetyl esterase/lipase